MQPSVPDCRVSVDGKPLPAEQAATLTRVNVDLDVDLFGCCVLLFNDPELQLINGTQFASGTPVKVELGSVGQKESVFQGEVVALEPQFRRDRPPSLQVICQEALHRLGLSSMTRAFNDVDDKQIAAQIAQEHGLTSDAPSGTSGHVLQANLSDAMFLRRIAQKSGNHLRIEGKQIVIGPPAKGAQIELGPASGVLKVRVQIKSNSQVNEVTVHGWDPAQKREIVGKASPQGVTGQGARQHGRGTLSALAHDPEPADVATAEAMARGRMRKMAEGFVTAQLELRGNPKIAPGAEMTLDKLGAQVGGTWRVEHAEHRFDKHGYRVKFRAVRIAGPKPPPKVAPPPQPPPAQPQPQQASPEPAPPQAIAGQRIEVKVVDAMGNPKPDFFFRLVKPGAPDQAGVTDAEGFIRLTLPSAGQWKLIFPDVDGSSQPAAPQGT